MNFMMFGAVERSLQLVCKYSEIDRKRVENQLALRRLTGLSVLPLPDRGNDLQSGGASSH
ncbi:MAG: hypothetical protein CBC35_05135 [Planctomycetes bacterium TMED75]|nr:MAG: hypothetical protein CBC35_05135 [Planctomycetes bacterium TMED75]